MQRIRAALRDAKRTDGFTLIELLVVVLILGILSAIVVVAVSNARANAVVSACKADVVQVAKAAQQYYVDENAWPANAAALAPKYINEVPSGEYSVAWDQATKTASATGGTGWDATKCPAVTVG